MSTRVCFTGNLDYLLDEFVLHDWFREHDIDVVAIRVMKDKETGRGRGFGFCQCRTDEDYEKALSLDGEYSALRELRISPANPPKHSKQWEPR